MDPSSCCGQGPDTRMTEGGSCGMSGKGFFGTECDQGLGVTHMDSGLRLSLSYPENCQGSFTVSTPQFSLAKPVVLSM